MKALLEWLYYAPIKDFLFACVGMCFIVKVIKKMIFDKD